MASSCNAVRLQQYLSKFFVNETKKNPNTFPDQQQYLIENYNPVVLMEDTFTALYFFPAVSKQEQAGENLQQELYKLFLE